MTQRDAFFGEVITRAGDDPRIVILSADSGAPAFDQFRKDRPSQWVHMGIAEQNMVAVAAGLALAGQQVYCYCIVPFITGRCFDHTKVAIALRGLPVTLVGVGAGYSYDDGGPTHYGVEDVGIMKNLKGIRILSPFDALSAKACAWQTLNFPGFRYVRLDRHVLPALEPDTTEVRPGEDLAVSAVGAMAGPAQEVVRQLRQEGLGAFLTVPLQVWPLEPSLWGTLAQGQAVVTIEEHFLTGGFGSAVSEQMHDHHDPRPLLRCALPDEYEWENGGREHLWRRARLDVPALVERIQGWVETWK